MSTTQPQSSGVANVLSMIMPAQSAAPQNTGPLGGLDLNSLFSKLVATGIIPKSNPESTSNTTTTVTTSVSVDTNKPKPKPVYIPNAVPKFEEPEEEPREMKEPLLPIPDISDFRVDKLKRRYKGVVQRLYEGIQCSTCGIRFVMDDTERYREHLDWHFRQNKRQNDEFNMAKNRQWHYEIDDWILYELIEESEEKTRSSVFENVVPGGDGNALSFKIPEGCDYIQEPPAQQDADNVCCICGDPFEQFWHEDNEDWHLRDALLVDNKYYHPVCFEDARDESVLEPTPTPTESPETNPLFNRRVSTGPAAMYTNVIPSTVKQEPPSSDSTSASSSSTHIEIRREIKTETGSEVKDEVQEVKIETQSNPEQLSQEKSEIKIETEVKTEVKTEPVPEIDTGLQTEIKNEPVPEVKNEPGLEVKTEPEVQSEAVPMKMEEEMKKADEAEEMPEAVLSEEKQEEPEPMESS
ncbi:hypothetical protein LOTGIDRAFT_170803 [Lottia gigantea]|uniref:PCFS4-like zinc finger domain-containing protein n=1 Tax=Lottia gigantea TaxID=225164 RepID=V4BF00_LOTGI|nr:hypothetical protein LOTGIDRAFT_170803 [Lottia gigantea]ESP04412.1 hypothetical protein LOTGIDRAFT_170803 [Lottia gigantea]